MFATYHIRLLFRNIVMLKRQLGHARLRWPTARSDRHVSMLSKSPPRCLCQGTGASLTSALLQTPCQDVTCTAERSQWQLPSVIDFLGCSAPMSTWPGFDQPALPMINLNTGFHLFASAAMWPHRSTEALTLQHRHFDGFDYRCRRTEVGPMRGMDRVDAPIRAMARTPSQVCANPDHKVAFR